MELQLSQKRDPRERERDECSEVNRFVYFVPSQSKFDQSEQGYACIISLGLLSKSSLDIVYEKEIIQKGRAIVLDASISL